MQKNRFINGQIKKISMFTLACVIWLAILQPIWTSNIIQYSNSNNGKKPIPFGEITANNTLLQEVKLKKDCHVDNIEINLATYARTNTNQNTFKIFINKKCVFIKTISSESLADNSYYEIENVNLEFKAKDEIHFVLESEDGKSGNAITAWVRPDVNNGQLYKYNSNNGSKILKGGEVSMVISEKEGTLRYISEKYLGATPTVATILFVILSALVVCLLYQLLNLKEKEEVNEVNHSDTLL